MNKSTQAMIVELNTAGLEVVKDLQLLGFTSVIVGAEVVKSSAKVSVGVAQTANLGFKALNKGLDKYNKSTESLESIMALIKGDNA